MRSLVAYAALLAFVGFAHAEDKAKKISSAVSSALDVSAKTLPPLVLIDNDTKLGEAFIDGGGSPDNSLLHVVVGMAADGHAGWVAADTGVIITCGMPGCDKILRDAAREANVKPPFHLTALVDDGKVFFLHIGSTGKGVGYTDAMEASISDDARPVVDQFKKSISDPKPFAASVSARKDVVLYGTDQRNASSVVQPYEPRSSRGASRSRSMAAFAQA